MLDEYKQLITHQFEAAICGLDMCIDRCAETAWDAAVVILAFCQVAFHTLFFADYYLEHCRHTKHRASCSTVELAIKDRRRRGHFLVWFRLRESLTALPNGARGERTEIDMSILNGNPAGRPFMAVSRYTAFDFGASFSYADGLKTRPRPCPRPHTIQ